MRARALPSAGLSRAVRWEEEVILADSGLVGRAVIGEDAAAGREVRVEIAESAVNSRRSSSVFVA